MGKLKMSSTSFSILKASVAQVDTEAARERYRSGDFLNADKVTDLNKRYRWDVAHSAVGTRWICDEYNAGLNDFHIDAALRALVAPL